MLDINNINKSYLNQLVLKDISFSLKEGEIVGFLGPNGAGKSTMMKIITGYILPDRGYAKLNGKDISLSYIETQNNIGYLAENNPLYLDMYVKEYLKYICDIRNINENKITETIDLVGLGKEKHKKIKELSKGYRQRVGLAQAIIHEPKILILDEPTTGLDPNQLLEIRDLIKNIGKNKTILFSTHIMQEVEAVCDRVIIINKGSIVIDKNIKDFTENENHVIYIEFDFKIEKEYISKYFSNLEEVENFRDSYWKFIFKGDRAENVNKIYSFCKENNLTILSLDTENRSLEKIFRDYTNN